MDKELSIAHMQGRFAMKVIYECGHVIQEDQPNRVADKIREWRTNVKISAQITE